MRKFVLTIIMVIIVLGIGTSCSVSRYDCSSVYGQSINTKSIPTNFYKGKVQKMHDSSIKRQKKTSAKADRAGSGTYRY